MSMVILLEPVLLLFTAEEGIIITGQGSTNDVTLKNDDADADVLTVATGTTNVDVGGSLTAATLSFMVICCKHLLLGYMRKKI